jgi:kinesin family protein 2/24
LFGTDHLQQNHAGDEEEMRIRVVVRKRPMSKEEVTVAGDVDVIHPLDYGSFGKILVYHPRTRVDLTKEIETVPFAFDHVFDERSSNADIYQRSVRNLIPSLFEGQWASIFAYGQTGSGKTFTMMGSGMTGLQQNGSSNGKNDPSNFGLYYMAALDVFDSIQTPAFEDFLVGTSMFEIYGGKLFDLLNERAQVKCLEDSKGNVCFPGLSEHEVASADDLIALIEQGATNRSTGTTSRNADSSRSHAVLQLHLRKNDGRRRNDEFSRLSFIDLAGSERGADTSNSCRATRLEGAEINTSLLALKEVIRALATGDSLVHVPFRGSKLTQVLKQSFVGKNCRSVMIACISPNIGNCEQTLNTLRYADRVKERNPETGELAPAKPTNGPKSHHQSQSSQLSLDSSSHSNTSDVLDDLLATPKNEKGGLKDRLAAENLVATHKEAMAVMLSMVKDEMSLVKKADTDREGLDEYVRQVENFQDKQLGLIATIREQLLQYRLAKAGAWANANGPDSDDSFEDLRD